MAVRARRSVPVAACALLSLGVLTMRAQVFTVGEKTATSDMKTDFTPTRVELPETRMTQRGTRELVRDLESEQGFAKRVLPLGSILKLQANGNLTPRADEYRKMIYKKGEAAGPGDRMVVTSLRVHGDSILIDLNGGPYEKHRFLKHVQIGVGNVGVTPPDPGIPVTGLRVALMFEGGVPEVSGPEVKALLAPLVDFGAKTGEIAYADTLPPPIKSAIESHEARVGMDRRMVLAALGAPDSKVRESGAEGNYEEWIYGHQPQPVKFIRFVGDKVTLVKIAAAGKAIDVQTEDRIAGTLPAPEGSPVSVSNGPPRGDSKAGPPSLRLPGDAPVEATPNTNGRVQYPPEHKPVQPPQSVPPEP